MYKIDLNGLFYVTSSAVNQAVSLSRCRVRTRDLQQHRMQLSE
jgi:hypothetical protein